MSSEADSLMSKIRQMEADRRKSNERIRQLEAALQSHAHLAATSLNVVPVTRPIYPSPSSVQPSSVAVGQPMMSPVVGSLTNESYSSVMSGGLPPPPPPRPQPLESGEVERLVIDDDLSAVLPVNCRTALSRRLVRHADHRDATTAARLITGNVTVQCLVEARQRSPTRREPTEVSRVVKST